MEGCRFIMPEENHADDKTILEASRLIKAFKEKFKAKTSDNENFLTINELESLWSELRKNTDVLYSDMIHQLINSIDEREIVSKKKENTPSVESNLGTISVNSEQY